MAKLQSRCAPIPYLLEVVRVSSRVLILVTLPPLFVILKPTAVKGVNVIAHVRHMQDEYFSESIGRVIP